MRLTQLAEELRRVLDGPLPAPRDILAAIAFAARLDAEAEQVRTALAEACHESA
ncbi:MAG: hypothetical protein ABIQ49_09115 [Gemmatimonadales bacterium]